MKTSGAENKHGWKRRKRGKNKL